MINEIYNTKSIIILKNGLQFFNRLTKYFNHVHEKLQEEESI